MAVNVEAIHRAVADKLRRGLARDTSVNPFPIGAPVYPSITVYPDSPYINYFETMGANGKASIHLKLKIEVDSDSESMFIKIADYLSVGTGNTSSVTDALMATDHTLGGLVDECVILSAEWDAINDPDVAWLPVQILVSKQNAQV